MSTVCAPPRICVEVPLEVKTSGLAGLWVEVGLKLRSEQLLGAVGIDTADD
jgi:hypothetical protein